MNYNYLKSWKQKALERTGGRGKALSFLLESPTKENDISFDLHIHDTNSDGERTPEKIFRDASENGLSVISITNHDTIKSENEYYHYKTNTGKYRGGFISGVEVTCRMNGLPVEILVYDYNENKAQRMIENSEFKFLDKNFKKTRNLTLIQQRIAIANSLKLTDKALTLDDFVSVEVPNEKGESKYVPFSKLGLDSKKALNLGSKKLNETIDIGGKTYKINTDNFNSKLFKYIAKNERGREFLKQQDIEIADFLKDKIDIESPSLLADIRPQFAKFNRSVIQSPTGAMFINDSLWWPKAEDVIRFAKNSGGVALLAHPFGYGSSVKASGNELMDMALSLGIDGIECAHGFNTAEQIEQTYDFARKNGLLISAGTDTHEYYSIQGDRTEIGTAPGSGHYKNNGDNPVDNMKLSLYNLHYVGSGAYKKDFAEENQMQ